jgi:hypothetical protein
VVQAAYDEPDLVLGEVDFDLTHRFRPNFPILRDIRADMYQQLREAVESEID